MHHAATLESSCTAAKDPNYATAWQAALACVLEALDPDSEVRRGASTTLPTPVFANLSAAEAAGKCLASIQLWDGEMRKLTASMQQEKAAANKATDAAQVSDARAAKLATRLTQLEAKANHAETMAKQANALVKSRNERVREVEQELYKRDAELAERLKDGAALTAEVARVTSCLSSSEDDLRAANERAARAPRIRLLELGVIRDPRNGCSHLFHLHC